jgi:hypothetical protein
MSRHERIILLTPSSRRKNGVQQSGSTYVSGACTRACSGIASCSFLAHANMQLQEPAFWCTHPAQEFSEGGQRWTPASWTPCQLGAPANPSSNLHPIPLPGTPMAPGAYGGTAMEQKALWGDCLDTHEMCPGWAARGECQGNPAFMLRSCRVSCGKCKPTKTATAARTGAAL